MRQSRPARSTLLTGLGLLVCALIPPAHAQQQPRPAPAPQEPSPAAQQLPPETDDVLRVEAELVQAAVTVVDKEGQFVGGLRREQFEMLIDGKPQPVSFFEQVVAGTAGERRHLAAAAGKGLEAAPPTPPAAGERGRTIFLFADDYHLSNSSFMLARKLLLHYVEAVMGQNDQAALVSTSGRQGFLQQLTDNRVVLRAAVSRLNFRSPSSNLTGRPPITLYQAVAVQERNDSLILEYLIDETLRTSPGMSRGVAEQLVRSRTRAIALEAAWTTKATLSALENLLRSSTRLPGRKVVLFLSDGFLLQIRDTDAADQLRRITDAAARSDAVVYAVDMRGLATDPIFDASRSVPPDPTGRGLSVAHGTTEMRAQQDPLRIISEETGGRAVVNTNALAAGMARVLDESAHYYLLAWRPAHEENRGGKFRRIEVTILGRPDLTVRLHRGYYAPGARPAPESGKTAAAPQDELRAALASVFPVRQLPVALAVNFVDMPDRGAVLTASAGVPSYPLSFKPSGGQQKATVELACVVFNDQGKPTASAQERLEVGGDAAAGASPPPRDIAYNFQFTKLPPGLYQVRVAARDGGGGLVGSAAQWIEIPDLKKGKLALSSLLVGRLPEVAQGVRGVGADPGRLDFNAAHQFARTARLGFYTYVYNASRGPGGRGAPDLTVRVQVWNSDRVIIDSGERLVATDGAPDPARLPYGADLSLASLPAGRYLLQVSVTDRQAKTTAVQSSRFEIK